MKSVRVTHRPGSAWPSKTLPQGLRYGLRCSHAAHQSPVPRGRASVVARSAEPPRVADLSKYTGGKDLDQAARRFQLGLEQGFEESELLALELGVSNLDLLPEAQRKYTDKIKEKLTKRAAEMKAEEEELKARMSRNLNLGKRAYEFGEYTESVKCLEQAVRDTGEDTALGGEAQLWLGLAYQACAREKDAIDLYAYIEATHPNRKVKKQAADLRYILEAPKLEISPDERVQIPLIQSDTWRQKERTSYAPKFLRPTAPPSKKKQSYWDRVPMEAPDPLAMLPDKWYVRIAFGVMLAVATVYINLKIGS